MVIYELQIRICNVLPVDQNLVIIWVSLPENKSNSLAFAEHVFFPLPVWSHIIPTSSSGLLDLKNVGIAVGIPLISCLRAQRHAIEVERSPS